MDGWIPGSIAYFKIGVGAGYYSTERVDTQNENL